MNFLKYLAKTIWEALILAILVGVVLAYILTEVLHIGG